MVTIPAISLQDKGLYMLKRIITIGALFLVMAPVWAQNRPNPIQWKYTAEKIDEKTYAVHITGLLESGWHAYSQNQPKEAVAQPTVIRFKTNPLVGIQGKVKEVGEMEHWMDQVSGIKANQYENQVDFIQTVKVRTTGKTSLTGTLTFQVCTDEMCLPPATREFAIELGQ